MLYVLMLCIIKLEISFDVQILNILTLPSEFAGKFS